MHFNILTLFPEMFPGSLAHSLSGKAMDKKLWSYDTINIRDFTSDNHKTVDDTPYGGGAGMVMKPEPISLAIDNLLEKQPKTNKIIYPSPRGKPLTQERVEGFVDQGNLNILCGRYEAIDHRVIEKYDIEEVSIGDYILSGGEAATFIIIDACVRILDGVIGNPQTHQEESFSSGKFRNLLEYPHYTKPEDWQGMKVPEVLKSGNHAKIDSWRLQKAEEITEKVRPDLWKKYKDINNKD